jgi:hypothetical protein
MLSDVHDGPSPESTSAEFVSNSLSAAAPRERPLVKESTCRSTARARSESNGTGRCVLLLAVGLGSIWVGGGWGRPVGDGDLEQVPGGCAEAVVPSPADVQVAFEGEFGDGDLYECSGR